MKIVFSVGSLTKKSGIVRVVTNIINELSLVETFEIVLLCTVIIADERPYIDSRVEIKNLEIYRKRKVDWIKVIMPIKKAIDELKPDVLIISGMEFIPFFYLTKIPKSICVYAWEHRCFNAGPKYRLEWFGKRIALEKFDGVISITKRDNEYYKKNSRLPNKCIQIYNLSDVETVDKKDYIQSVDRQKYQIISCGSLSFIKGFDMLINVAKKLYKINRDWTWDIYGDGEEREFLETLIKKNGLEKKVFLKGYSDNIKELYKNYSLFVLTSRMEGMGMVIVEALYSGIPVVSFDIDCGPSDVIADGINGYLIPPFDEDIMAERINELLCDANKRYRFAEKTDIKLGEFTKEVIVDKWIKLINGE